MMPSVTRSAAFSASRPEPKVSSPRAKFNSQNFAQMFRYDQGGAGDATRPRRPGACLEDSPR